QPLASFDNAKGRIVGDFVDLALDIPLGGFHLGYAGQTLAHVLQDGLGLALLGRGAVFGQPQDFAVDAAVKARPNVGLAKLAIIYPIQK
ncbi:hypothetical protein LCGC14_2231080, partial [marine sediment metagenome]